MTTTAASANQEKLFDEICAQNQHFEHYEKMFQEVLVDLENDDLLEIFRREYETLHSSFLKCHEGERRLIKKCLDLAAEVNACLGKIRAAEEYSAGDQQTIEQLQREIDRSKGKLSLSRETELTLKEKIKHLKSEIKELDRKIERGPTAVLGRDASMTHLTRVYDELHRDHDSHLSQMAALEGDVTMIRERIARLEVEKQQKMDEVFRLKDATTQKQAELEEQLERKSSKEFDLKVTKENLARRLRVLQETQGRFSNAKEELSRLKAALDQAKVQLEVEDKQLLSVAKELTNVRRNLETCTETSDQLAKEGHGLATKLKQKESEVQAIHRDVVKQERLLEAILRRNAVMEGLCGEAQASQTAATSSMQRQELENEGLSKTLDNDHKQLEYLSRERDILNKNYLKTQTRAQRQKDWLVVKENQRRNVEHQLRGYERHAQRQNDVIHQLTREGATYEASVADHGSAHANIMEEIQRVDEKTSEEQKRIADAEARLKHQQSMLETVLNERNVHSKNYNQLRSEIIDMTRRFKVMLSQIRQLKDEIQYKERELVTEEANVTVQATQRKRHEMEISSCKEKAEAKEKRIETYNAELHRLNQIIAEADAERKRQQREHSSVINERDILGNQLIRRNDELAKLYESIRVQQSMLRKGEAQYLERVRDVNTLQVRLAQLGSSLDQMKDYVARIPDLRVLVNKAQRELTREQCRVRSLLDECDHLQNVHRIHYYACSQPQLIELQTTVQALQRTLVQKTSEVQKKEELIGEREKLYIELKAIVSRQPGPEVAEQLNLYQGNLSKKAGQLRAMKQTLRHFQEQVELQKSRYEELHDELQTMSTKYQTQHRRDAARRRQEQNLREIMRGAGLSEHPTHPPDEVYVGYTAPPRPRTSESDGDGSPPRAEDDTVVSIPGET